MIGCETTVESDVCYSYCGVGFDDSIYTFVTLININFRHPIQNDLLKYDLCTLKF